MYCSACPSNSARGSAGVWSSDFVVSLIRANSRSSRMACSESTVTAVIRASFLSSCVPRTFDNLERACAIPAVFRNSLSILLIPMAISKIAQPQFNPYGDDAPLPKTAAGPWKAPLATGPFAATIALPGSKSLTNRELVLAALATGPSLLRAPLHSRDSSLMIEGLRALGVRIDEVQGTSPYGADLLVTPGDLEGGVSIDCGLAGTVMRFLPPLAALAVGPVAFDGDPHARTRPMRAMLKIGRAS